MCLLDKRALVTRYDICKCKKKKKKKFPVFHYKILLFALLHVYYIVTVTKEKTSVFNEWIISLSNLQNSID